MRLGQTYVPEKDKVCAVQSTILLFYCCQMYLKCSLPPCRQQTAKPFFHAQELGRGWRCPCNLRLTPKLRRGLDLLTMLMVGSSLMIVGALNMGYYIRWEARDLRRKNDALFF